MKTRRRVPALVLVLLFVAVPLIEIYVIIQVGQVIGAWWTILLLVADSLLGSWLLKREGGRAWRALQQALQSGRMPAKELADGALVLVGGTLMLTPGFVTDVVALFCILPFTRPVARRALAAFVARRLQVVPGGFPGPFGGPAGSPGPGPDVRHPGDRYGGGPVVRGEVVDPEE